MFVFKFEYNWPKDFCDLRTLQFYKIWPFFKTSFNFSWLFYKPSFPFDSPLGDSKFIYFHPNSYHKSPYKKESQPQMKRGLWFLGGRFTRIKANFALLNVKFVNYDHIMFNKGFKIIGFPFEANSFYGKVFKIKKSHQ